MKRFLLFISILLFVCFFPVKTRAQGNQTVLNGAATTPVSFPGGSCTYQWTNNQPGIGLPASGTGNIASFTAVNTGSSPIIATITATPAQSEYAYIVNTYDNTVSVINVLTQIVVATVPVGGQAFFVWASPDGNHVYVSNEGPFSVTVINTANYTVAATIPLPHNPYGLIVSPDSKQLYVGNGPDVSIINTATNMITGTIVPPNTIPGTDPYELAFSPDGSILYVADGSSSNSISVINTITGAAYTLPSNEPMYLVVSPDGKLLYAVIGYNNYISVINTATHVASVIALANPAGSAVLSPDGSLLYATGGAPAQNPNPLHIDSVYVINTAANKVIKTISVGKGASGVSITPDGKQLYVCNNYSNTVSVINTATNTVTATIPVGNGPTSLGSFITSGPPCTGSPVSFTITINSTTNIQNSAVTGNISACAGNPSASPNIEQFAVTGNNLTANLIATAPAGFEVSLTPASGYGSSVTLNATAGTVNSTTIYVRSAATAPVGNPLGNVVLSSTGNISQSVAVTGRVYGQTPASVSIVASANNVCAGTPVTFTATPVNGGSAPAYQWQVYGTNAGTNSPTFTSSTLPNGALVTCTITSNSPCATVATAGSNKITMIVNPQAPRPAVSITASGNNVCTGTPVTFTATTVNGGSAPLYRWQVNNTDAGTNSPVFITSTLANNDVITCTITSSTPCATPATGQSNSIIMDLPSQGTSPSISITASATNVCTGAAVTFTATPVNAGGTPSYQWQVNGSNAGTNSPVFTTSALANNDKITCIITTSIPCTTDATAASNLITMNVASQAVSPSVSIAASANSVCAGTPVTFTASPANGGSAPFYQWQINNTDVGTNSPIFTSSTLAGNDVVSCTVTSNATCVTPAAAASNPITVSIIPPPVVNAGGNKTIKLGQSTTLNGTAGAGIADITWGPAAGLSNNKILNPVASPTLTTTYVLMVQATDGCIGLDSATVVVLQSIAVPNAFTPNGDGINDTWDIKYLNAYQNCTVKVFNRWGQLVFNSIGYGIPWNGTYNGSALPTGTYYYLINLKNNSRLLSGFVEIVR
jgi:gliding motility-associated-like protein